MTLKMTLVCLLAASGMGVSGAQAGCLKGAVVGGVAGHVAGKHGLAGAAVGCAVGHHMSKKKDETARAQAAKEDAERKNSLPAPAK